MLYGKSILSIENVGWALWVLVEFNLLWIGSDYEFYSGFDNKNNAQIFCVQFFCFILQPRPFFFFFFVSPVFTSKDKARYAELYFCM